MSSRILSKISQNKKLIGTLKFVGWVAAVSLIVLALLMSKTQEISFVYNNF